MFFFISKFHDLPPSTNFDTLKQEYHIQLIDIQRE